MVENCYLPPNLGTPGFDGPSEMILIACHDPKYDGVVLAKKENQGFIVSDIVYCQPIYSVASIKKGNAKFAIVQYDKDNGYGYEFRKYYLTPDLLCRHYYNLPKDEFERLKDNTDLITKELLTSYLKKGYFNQIVDTSGF